MKTNQQSLAISQPTMRFSPIYKKCKGKGAPFDTIENDPEIGHPSIHIQGFTQPDEGQQDSKQSSQKSFKEASQERSNTVEPAQDDDEDFRRVAELNNEMEIVKAKIIKLTDLVGETEQPDARFCNFY